MQLRLQGKRLQEIPDLPGRVLAGIMSRLDDEQLNFIVSIMSQLTLTQLEHLKDVFPRLKEPNYSASLHPPSAQALEYATLTDEQLYGSGSNQMSIDKTSAEEQTA
jgi:hypothetical protein